MNDDIKITTVAGPNVTWVPIIIAGLVTSALTLVFTWAVGDYFNLMGFYLWFVVPVGALIAGLGAGSGYGLASLLLGTKISGRLLALVLALQVAVYFAAQYLEFLVVLVGLGDEGIGYGFISYFDEMTASFSFDGSNGLGLFGYVFRLLEIAGFAVGGVIAPALLHSKPYCEVCSRYMRSKKLGVIPAGVQSEAWNEGNARLRQLQALAAADDISGFQDFLLELAKQRELANRVSVRFVVSVQGCPRCGSGFVCSQLHRDQGEQVEVLELDKTAAAPALVRRVLEAAGRSR